MKQLRFSFYQRACPRCHKAVKLNNAYANYPIFLDGSEQHYCGNCGIGFGYHWLSGSFK